jgi:hypothetical protein
LPRRRREPGEIKAYRNELAARGLSPSEVGALVAGVRSFGGKLKLDYPHNASFTLTRTWWEERVRGHVSRARLVFLLPCARAGGGTGGKDMTASQSHRFASAITGWEPGGGLTVERLIVSEPYGLIPYGDKHEGYNYPPRLIWVEEEHREVDRWEFRMRLVHWLGQQEPEAVVLWSGLTGGMHHLRILWSAWFREEPLLAAVPARGIAGIAFQARALRHVIEQVAGLRASEPWDERWDGEVRWVVLPSLERLRRTQRGGYEWPSTADVRARSGVGVGAREQFVGQLAEQWGRGE